MTPAARYAAAIDILDTWFAGAPVEKALTGWARKSRFAGSKDRAAIRDIVFDCVRCKRSFSARGGSASGRGIVLGKCLSQDIDIDKIFTGDGYAPARLTEAEDQAKAAQPEMSDAVRLDVPDWLFEPLEQALGGDFEPVLIQMQNRAPIVLRVNLSRCTVPALCERLLEDKITTVADGTRHAALIVTENARKLRQSSAFADGWFEFQDLSSQVVCDEVPLSNSMRVLDYCAGGGGKALAFADRLSPHGQVYAHDIDPDRMRDLPERAARAGVSVSMLKSANISQHAPFDVVFCDAPCSGTGAWRRAPDGKWRLTEDRLNEIKQTQAQILERAKVSVSENGRLVYATCSFLNTENEDQIEQFLKQNSGWICEKMQRFGPIAEGDGFFTAHLTRA